MVGSLENTYSAKIGIILSIDQLVRGAQIKAIGRAVCFIRDMLPQGGVSNFGPMSAAKSYVSFSGLLELEILPG